MPEFKDRLENLFKDLGLSQAALARKTGITQSSFSEYLAGKKEPTIAIVSKIATVIGVNLNWLLLGEGDMFRDESINRKIHVQPEDIPKENIKGMLDGLWEKADKNTRVWLEIEIKMTVEKCNEWLQKKKNPDI